MSLLPVFINAPSRYVAQPDGSNLIELTVLMTAEEAYRLFDLVAHVEATSELAAAIRAQAEREPVLADAKGGFWP